MLAVRHARERGERFALAAGAQHDDLVVGHVADVKGIDDVLVGDLEVAELAGDLGVRDHGAARHDDLAAHGRRGVAHLLQTVDVAREARDEHATRRVLDDVPEGGAHRGLTRGEAGHVGVRGVGEHEVDALLAKAVDGVVVGAHAVDGRLVELEVARVEHGAGRRLEEDSERARDGVRHGEELQREAAEVDARAIRDLAELGALDVVLGELALDHAERELAREDGDLVREVHEQVRERARVVLVAVRDDDAAELLLVLEHIRVVGKDEVDAGLVVVGEHEAGVDEHHVVAALERRHVLADAVETTQRDDPQGRVLCHMSGKPPWACVDSASGRARV